MKKCQNYQKLKRFDVTLENFILNKKIEDIKILYPKIIDDDQEEFCTNFKK